MNGYYRDRSGGISRWLTVLAIVFFAFFVLVGAVIGSNYQHLGNLLKVISLVRTQYIEPVQVTELVDGATRGIVDALEDPYSVYLDPQTFKQLQEQITGSFGGLGILVGLNKEEMLTVVRVYDHTPAAEAGVQAGDIITGIDARDVQGLDLDTAVGLMRGPVGSKIRLSVLREGHAEPLEFKITRQEISVPTVEGELLPDSSIGYIAISQFNEKTSNEMMQILGKLKGQGMQGIILDLRDNPGGELTAATQVADNFIPKGPIVYIDYRTGKEEIREADDDYLKLPLAVLVNGGSASASEILAGAVKDTEAGVLVGTKTFGKGIVQTVYTLDNDAGLKLTTARYLTPKKKDIHKKGVLPDVVVENLPDQPGDEQLDKAIALVKQKL
ncbi:Carboxy-terminal processing protease CtpB precursor [Sporotomaculum syntrophicum]|uniref:Carboxy-terminal processing protease CtpB n=1 Tax=Sporotomaculum syntrophicum TaxID=182264 RepID=A0A9D2WSH6_9FIRM|nr:S41 family peptidase [Sporotomaculum syntrophicum]KAF1086116.1 Carboxy-terminal processing protease CtpB precursor [Sporotomaculum syntrophicum]